MEEKVGGESYNEFKDSPLYAFFKKLFRGKQKADVADKAEENTSGEEAQNAGNI